MRKSWQLDRRTFLRGAGTSLALPWLNGMAWATPKAKPSPRMCFFYFHYGVPVPPDNHPLRKKHSWFPTGEGKNFEFTGLHDKLVPFRNKLTFFGGVQHPNPGVNGHGAGDVYLTGANLAGQNYRQSVSVDQVAAEVVGKHTRFSSLVLGSAGGVNRPYRSATLSYDRDGRPIPTQNNPREIFRRLFGVTGGDERIRLGKRASMLDAVLDQAKALDRRLGVRDQQKMDEYLTSVREVEQRIERSEKWLDVPKPEVPEASLNLDIEATVPVEYMNTMFDLLVLAFQTDSTRVGTYQIAGENSMGPEANFPLAVGIKKTSHGVSHEGGDYEQWSKYVRLFSEQYARFLGRLEAIEENDGSTLLDNTMSMLGSCTSKTHAANNYPLILSGGNNLGLKHGAYLKYKDRDMPLNNIFATMLNKMGTGKTSFNDSTGMLSDIVA